MLEPGESYAPREAMLVIPDIREWSQQIVRYHVGECQDPSGTVTITFEPPVPTFIRSFDAVARDTRVVLSWEVFSDEKVLGFKIYRSSAGEPAAQEITANGLIPAHERTHTDQTASSGQTYQYTLVVVGADGSELRSQTATVKTGTYTLTLYQNSPNPFNPTTTMSFTLPELVSVTLSIYDVEGRRVRTLVEETMKEGYHERIWDGTDANGTSVGSGVYFYRIRAGNRTITKKMVLLK
jgi:hypothetical protein